MPKTHVSETQLLNLQKHFTLNVAKLIEFIYSHKFTCTFGEAYRTPEQAAIYAKKGIGVFDSQHCKRLAIDLHIFNTSGKFLTDVDDYKQFGTYWKSLDMKNRWGGDFKSSSGKPFPDGNHFESREDNKE